MPFFSLLFCTDLGCTWTDKSPQYRGREALHNKRLSKDSMNKHMMHKLISQAQKATKAHELLNKRVILEPEHYGCIFTFIGIRLEFMSTSVCACVMSKYWCATVCGRQMNIVKFACSLAQCTLSTSACLQCNWLL